MTITKDDYFVTGNGGLLHYRSSDGELLMEVRIPAGRVSAASYLDMLSDGEVLETADDIAVHTPRRLSGIVEHPGAYETGANPDYRPPVGAQLAHRQMEAMVASVQSTERRIEARLKAAATAVMVAPLKPVVSELVEPPVVE